MGKPRGEWVVIGSGPDAGHFLGLCQGRRVACVNGAYGAADPDLYGIFETEAYPVFGQRYEELHRKGKECYTRVNVILQHNAPGIALPLEMGYEAGGMDHAPFNASGVSMLLAVAHRKRPEVLHMLGFHGYGDRRDASMSHHIAKITNLYMETKFRLYGTCIMPGRNAWRVEHVTREQFDAAEKERQRLSVGEHAHVDARGA